MFSPKSRNQSVLLCIRKFISTNSCLYNFSHYKSLGITPNATQNDIKSAYYKLSMIYHPDKNKGSKSAAQKFREITTAYEVLGNYRLRRLYDKGILHTAGARFSDTESAEPEVEDDAQTKFYKARMHRSKAPHASGRTPIYDFDEWSRSHYGASFDRTKTAQQRFDRRKEEKATAKMEIQNEQIIMLTLFAVTLFFFYCYGEKNNDDVKIGKTNETNDKPKDKS